MKFFGTLAILLLPLEIFCYPVYGTKRYGRTPPLHSWASPVQVPSYYYIPRAHYPMYDAISPYVQEYNDEYYLPQEYPMYYPMRSPKYDYYQALPYYYDERHAPRNGYGYYEDLDPEELQEQLQQEEERVEREEALPVGQETWYENQGANPDDSIDDINAAFLQNLMIYNNAMSDKNYDYNPQMDPYYNEEILNWNEELNNKKQEDEDVKELKMLVEKPKKQRKNKNKNKNNAEERLKMFEKGKKTSKVPKEPNNSEAWINYNKRMPNYLEPIANLAYKKVELPQHGGPTIYKENSKSSSTRKQSKIYSTQAPVTTKVPENRDARGGQKEVVLMRPATPVRRPFSQPVMELLAKQNGERKRDPNVYETIKHLLEMEKILEKDNPPEEIRPNMRKRYVSTEESLVDQLSTLKKTA